MSGRIRAIIALGNPGPDHAGNRHNVGFWLADALAGRWRVHWSAEKRFKGDLARHGMGGDTVWLLKPMTYMNVSGDAVQPLCAFHKIAPEQLLVVHDDMDLPAGTARMKQSGGHGGHNGLRDIHRVIGGNYRRLRLGIGRPGERGRVLAHVLSSPSPDERTAIEAAIEACLEAIETTLEGGWDRGAQQLNSRKAESG